MKRIINSNIFKVIIISFILASLIIVPNIIIGKGVYTLVADLNIQQIPFNIAINNSIKSGSYLWCWFNDLGSNFIATFSFYNLFSPFNIIGYLFPAEWFKYLLGPIFILKYVVASLTSYLFLKRYVKNKKYAMFGAILYSFSGFQLTNTLFYHFHDVVALFPLLLYTLDNYWYDNKKYSFMLCVALMCLTNWYFFIGEVVFLFIYFFINIILKNYKWDFKRFFHLAVESILGIGISAFVLIPSLLFTIGNPRVDGTWTLKSMFIYSDKRTYLELLRAFIFPNQIMGSRDFITDLNWSSTETFLPFVGSVLAISYLLKYKKSVHSILYIILFVFMFIPIFNSSFFVFTNAYYSRWFYLFTLISALLSIKCLDENVSFSGGIISSILILIILLSLIILYTFVKKINLIYNSTFMLIYFIMFIFYILIFYILSLKPKYKFRILFIFTLFFIVIWGNFTIYRFKGNSVKTDVSYLNYLNFYNNLEYDPKYRTNTFNINYNLGYLNGSMNLQSWNSNINKENFDFYNALDYNRGVATIIEPQNLDYNSFLSVKYIYSSKYDDLEKYGYKLYKELDNYKIYINNKIKDFGFTLNDYILDSDFRNLSTSDKYKILNKKYVLNSNQIIEYGDLIKNNGTILNNEYQFISNGFKANVKVSKDSFIIYTIPCDKGWKIKINGEYVNYECIDNGLIGLKVFEGDNLIEFCFFPIGLKIGLIISSVSIIIGTCLIIVYRKRRRYE